MNVRASINLTPHYNFNNFSQGSNLLHRGSNLTWGSNLLHRGSNLTWGPNLLHRGSNF
jgi:hypothetical protein